MNNILDEFNKTFTRLYSAENELKDILGNVGKNIKVVPPLYVEKGSNIFLGDDVHLNIETRIIDNRGCVQFGDRVLTGPYLEIVTSDNNRQGNIIIGSDVWIGGGVKILPGITIGEGSVIAAGSIVEQSIPANVLAVGFPARPIKEINKSQKNTKLDYIQKQLAFPRMLKGEMFYTSASDAIKMKKNAYEFFNTFNRKHTYLKKAEKELSKIFGYVGKNTQINTPFYFSFGSQIFLGNNITFQDGIFLGDTGRIVIGNGAILESEVQIYTTNHLLDKDERIYIQAKDVIIGKNVKLGKGTIVLPGVTIGDGAQIAENSVVKDNIPSDAFASGIPAKIQA